MMQAVIRKVGNSLGLRIPSLWAKDNDIKTGSNIKVIVKKEKIIIFPQKKYLSCDFIKKVTAEEIKSVIDNIKAMIE